jgi:hypothetical protein
MFSIKSKLKSDLKYYGKILDELEKLEFAKFSSDDDEVMAKLRSKLDSYRKLYHVINELIGDEESHPQQ